MANTRQTTTTGNQRLQNELTALGARPLVNFDLVSARPFEFNFTVTDNATTASDLTLAASCDDDELITNYGFSASSPDIIMHITAVSAQLNTLRETNIIIQELFQRLALHHQAAGGRSQSINLCQFMTQSSYENGATANAESRMDPIVYELAAPWQVNFRSDTFEIRPTTAVDTAGGNLTGSIAFYGFCWPTAQGEGSGISCPDRQTAQAIGLALRVPPPVGR